MEAFELDEHTPREDRLTAAGQLLARGRIGAVATDTSWSLVTSALNASGANRLAGLRATPSRGDGRRPMSLICADLAMVGTYALIDQQQFRLVRRLLPGPYTILLPASRAVPRRLQSKRRAIGIRIPDKPLITELVRRADAPLFATTARGRDGEALTSLPDVIDAWERDLDLYIESTPITPSASTVLDLTSGTPVVLREGLGPIESDWEIATDEESSHTESLRDRRGRLQRR
jgi:tRNA threonylcarbamoyl adenosine modification protein (Sua5/YciO/YrdC/YwlC family)